MVDINNYLPVTDKNGKYVGVITQKKVNDILSEMKEEER